MSLHFEHADGKPWGDDDVPINGDEDRLNGTHSYKHVHYVRNTSKQDFRVIVSLDSKRGYGTVTPLVEPSDDDRRMRLPGRPERVPSDAEKRRKQAYLGTVKAGERAGFVIGLAVPGQISIGIVVVT